MRVTVEISDDEVARAFLASVAPRVERASMHAIVAAVSERTGVSQRDILGTSRVRPIAKARQAAMALCREQGFSLPQIGQVFRRDHTTILHACRVMAPALERAADAASPAPVFRSRRAAE